MADVDWRTIVAVEFTEPAIYWKCLTFDGQGLRAMRCMFSTWMYVPMPPFARCKRFVAVLVNVKVLRDVEVPWKGARLRIKRPLPPAKRKRRSTCGSVSDAFSPPNLDKAKPTRRL